MLLIDLTVPLERNLPFSPGRAPFPVRPVKRVVLGKS
jgi:hypothetical protein